VTRNCALPIALAAFGSASKSSNHNHLPGDPLNLLLHESPSDGNLEFPFSFKVQLPMGEVVDEKERADGV
jgi:hypothetical protein